LTRPPLLVAVPNISEGRRPDLVRTVAGDDNALLDVHIDPDHNRSVLTYGGPPDEIFAACTGMIERAVASLDISNHTGAHPRFGVVDVLPIVRHRASDDDASQLAHGLAAHAAALDVPVHLYGLVDPDRRSLPELRRTLRVAHQSHPTAGVVCIGVREPLVAFNVNLHTSLVRAGAIVRRVRELPGIRALAFELTSRGLVQVSMNLTQPETAGPTVAYNAVAALAPTQIEDAEVVGLIPASLERQLEGIPLRTTVRTIEGALAER
jgi:glutamate formiminotransferase